MNSEDKIRAQIQWLYEKHPRIHMDVSLSRPKLLLEGAEATITGVYPHIFQIEEITGGKPKTHTLKYTDVIIRRIIIHEAEKLRSKE